MKKLVIHFEAELPEEEDEKILLAEIRNEMKYLYEDFGFAKENVRFVVGVKECV